jgi:DNA-directed RNA polymerase specialized sigma24 family protein
VNLALDGAARRSRTRRELTGEAPPDRFDEAGDTSASDPQDELLNALAALPPRQRSVLVLRYFGADRERAAARH